METDIQLKGKQQSRHLKFDRGTFLVGMKGKAEACPVSCFLLPQAPPLSPLVKWHHLCLPGRKKAPSPEAEVRSLVRLWLGVKTDTTQTSSIWKTCTKNKFTITMTWTPELFPAFLNVHCLKDLQENWCIKTNSILNAMNFLPVSVIRLTVSWTE